MTWPAIRSDDPIGCGEKALSRSRDVGLDDRHDLAGGAEQVRHADPFALRRYVDRQRLGGSVIP